MSFKIYCILGFYLGLQAANAATHSLKYFYTAVSGDISFPEFTAVGQVDHDQFMYFDSNTRNAVPSVEWFRNKEDAEYWDSRTQGLIGEHQFFKAIIEIVKDRFNQSKSTGVHTLQKMYGCEWNDVTGDTHGLLQFGYDGGDFIALSMKTYTWIARTPQAVITKHKWDNDKANSEYWRDYLTQTCVDLLKRCVGYGRSTLERTDPPKVSVFQRSSSSPVTCLATGFYPSGVMMSWKKDGKDHHEDVDLGATLPNPDGTFQVRSTLNVSPEQLKNHKFDCVVDHKSLEREMVTPWENGSPIGLIIGVAVGLLVLALIVAGIIYWKKKSNKGFKPANTSDNGSDNSSNPPA